MSTSSDESEVEIDSLPLSYYALPPNVTDPALCARYLEHSRLLHLRFAKLLNISPEHMPPLAIPPPEYLDASIEALRKQLLASNPPKPLRREVTMDLTPRFAQMT